MTSMATILKAKAQLVAIKVVTRIVPAPRPLVFVGYDSAMQLCSTINQLGVKRVLIVTDKVLEGLGVIQPLASKFREYGIEPLIFSGVTPDPTARVIESGIQMLQAERCDGVLAVGGGSSIDAAKVIALAATNSKSPQQLIGIMKARKPSLPLFVVPTTAGTGSEVTIGAVISDNDTHQKSLVIDPKVIPLAAALDAKMMQGMPSTVTADTGLDALTHALEAWMSDFATEESDYYAGAAVRLVFQSLRAAWSDGKNIESREAMALAAHYAGLSLNLAGIGYVHAIAHQLGAHYGVPHGRANAIVLPYVLDFNRQVSESRMAKLARLTGICNPIDKDEIAANALVNQVKSLIGDLHVDNRVSGIKKEHFSNIATAALEEAHGTYAVPRYMSRSDVEIILRDIQESQA